MNKLIRVRASKIGFASIGLIACIIVILSSCKENTILPPDLVPAVDNINTFQQDTFTVVTHTTFDDSILTGGIRNGLNVGADADFSHAIGTILSGAPGDAIFGKTIGSAYVQVRPPSPAFAFSGTNQVIDSIIVAVNYETAYGDTMMAQNQTFNLYRTPENKPFDSTYYEFSSITNLGTWLDDAQVSFNTIRTDSPLIGGVRLRPRVSFKLDTNFRNDLQSQTAATGFLDYPTFLTWLGGFYITPDSSIGNTLGYFDTDNTAMYVYYRFLNSNSEADTTVAVFPFDATYCTRFNNIKRNYAGSPASNFIETGTVGGDSLLYIQSEPGLASLVTFPNIGNFPNAIINKAELSFTALSSLDSGTFNIPPQLQLVYINENGEDEVLEDYIQFGTTRVGGKRNWATIGTTQQIEYVFNITHTIQNAITLQNSNFALKMSGARNDYPASNRVVLRGSGSGITLEKPNLNIIFTKIQ